MSWEKVRLGDVLNYEQPTKYIVDSENYNKDFKTPVLTAGKSFILGYTDETDGIYNDLPVIIFDDFTADIKFVDFPFKVKSSAMKILKANEEKADIRFLFYKMQTLNIDCEQHKRYWISKFAIHEIELPPLSTQKRIADILDTADALRRKDQELLTKYDQLTQAIFIDMFGDPVKNEKGWEVKKLGEVCDKITDGTHFSPPNVLSGIPYITAKHIKQDVINFYSNPTYISKQHHAEIYSRCTPKKGDVLYIKDGATTGIAAVNEFEFEFSMLSSLALIKPNKLKLNSYFLSSYLNNEIVKKELIRSYMAGAAIKRFTLDKINKFEIVLPSIDLQNSYEIKWKKLQESINNVKASHSTSLFSSLIQQAFNGTLVS
jgi:type I restriction enzyme S subunit